MKLLNQIKRVAILAVFGMALFSCEHLLFTESRAVFLEVDETTQLNELCLQRVALDSDSDTDRSNICPLTQGQ